MFSIKKPLITLVLSSASNWGLLTLLAWLDELPSSGNPLVLSTTIMVSVAVVFVLIIMMRSLFWLVEAL